jgi:hypothetical protein
MSLEPAMSEEDERQMLGHFVAIFNLWNTNRANPAVIERLFDALTDMYPPGAEPRYAREWLDAIVQFAELKAKGLL